MSLMGKGRGDASERNPCSIDAIMISSPFGSTKPLIRWESRHSIEARCALRAELIDFALVQGSLVRHGPLILTCYRSPPNNHLQLPNQPFATLPRLSARVSLCSSRRAAGPSPPRSARGPIGRVLGAIAMIWGFLRPTIAHQVDVSHS